MTGCVLCNSESSLERKPLLAMNMKGNAENPENGERLGYFRKPESDVSDIFASAHQDVSNRGSYPWDHEDIQRKA